MPDVNSIKNELIENLWIRFAKKGGDTFFPRLKKNKRMKVLTLTNDANYKEVQKFIDSKLTHKGNVFIWNHDYIKAFRLDADGKANKVLGSTRYEDSVNNFSHELFENFPFELINLDFSSQDPESEDGRLEREVKSLEYTIKFQNEKRNGRKGYVLIFTTLINSKNLNCDILIQNCRGIVVNGWTTDISFQGSPGVITDYSKKVEIIESILNQLSEKYRFNIEIEKMEREQQEGKHICSIAGIIKHRG